jgi:indolepyruvate ferredoxin oxidoreductase
LRRKQSSAEQPDPASLPPLTEPTLPSCTQAYGIVVAGIGGTGVITIGQLLGVAAHLEGKGVVTQEAAGLAQKGGATWSHVQIAEHQRGIHTTKVGMAEADLVLGLRPHRLGARGHLVRHAARPNPPGAQQPRHPDGRRAA